MRLLAIAISLCVLTAGRATAQDQTTPPGWSLYPSASVGAVYDDNLFFRRDRSLPREGVVYTRFGLNLDAVHRGRTSSFRGGYGLGGEYFTGDTEDLTRVPSDQSAYVDVSTSLGQRNTLGTSVSYTISHRPNRVFEDVGPELGRRRAEGYSANVQFSRQLTPKNSLGVNYAIGYQQLDAPDDFEDDDGLLARESVSHQASMSWTHSIGEQTGGTFQYAYRLFDNQSFASILPELEGKFQSHVATYGWTFQLGPRTSISASGGPNFFQDLDQDLLEPSKIWRVTPQGNFSFGHGWEHTGLTLSYSRAQSQYVGSTGSIITDSLGAAFDVSPARRVSFTFSAGASRSSRRADVFETYRAGVNGRLEITRWWSLDGSYGFTSQDRGFLFADDRIGSEEGRINRNSAYIGITIGKTVPLE